MRVAGIRLRDGRTLWVDAGAVRLAILDRAEIAGPGGTRSGIVCITPEQLARAPDPVDGSVVEAYPHVAPEDDCADLPGAEMPPLGWTTSIGQHRGVVVAVDAVRLRVTLRGEDGQDVQVDAAE